MFIHRVKIPEIHSGTYVRVAAKIVETFGWGRFWCQAARSVFILSQGPQLPSLAAGRFQRNDAAIVGFPAADGQDGAGAVGGSQRVETIAFGRNDPDLASRGRGMVQRHRGTVGGARADTFEHHLRGADRDDGKRTFPILGRQISAGQKTNQKQDYK